MIYKHREQLFIVVLLLMFFPLNVLSATPSSVEKEGAQQVAIFPFEVHSSEGALSLQKQIAARLSTGLTESGYVEIVNEGSFQGLIKGKKADDRLAVLVGRQTGAGFVVVGSLTKLGDMLSTDVGVINVKSGYRSTVFAQGNDLDSLILRLKNDILLKILAGQRIAEVRLAGNLRIENDVIYNVMKSTKGNLFSKEDLSSDIKAIYKIGYFKDVRAKITDTHEGKVIALTLEELPLITSADIEGTDKIKKEDLEGLISVKEKQVFNLNKVQSDMGSITLFYKNAGYLNAQVTYRLEEQEKGVRVVFDIKENRKLSIKALTLEGNRAYTDKELKDIMKTSEEGLFHVITDSGKFDETQLKQDINRLMVFYLNNGYVNTTISEPEITHDNEGIYIKILITEGKQYRVGNVEISGDILNVPRSELMSRLQITMKDYFDREAIMKDIDILTEACKEDGYAYASVVPRTLSRNEEQKIDVTYNIEKGNLVYINRISVTGNTTTRDKVIRRQLASVEGELYDSSKVKTSYTKLNSLRYFEEVNFQTEKGPDEGLMDIDVHVKEKSTGMFSIGAGYSALDNLVFMTQISQQNLFGRGQTLSLSAYLGASSTNYELSFTEPWLFDMPLWSKFDLWDMSREYDTYDVDTQGFRTTLGYPLFERVAGYVGYELKTDTVKNVADSASSYVKTQEGTLTSSGVTLTLGRNTTNDTMFPSEGSKNSISVQHTGTIFQGDASFTKYTANSSWFFPLPLDNVFGVRGRMGYIHPNEGKEIPVYERFSLGGMNSLRGLREVGPVDSSGDYIGGETMLNFTAEIVIPLAKEAGIKGVVFFDMGNTWNEGYHLDDMRKTAGMGVRWYSPMGPLRLEWGYVLDRKETEPASRWEFTIGMFM
ncbi:MAG: outer membrane protein assembly factor BamA [Syntrophales bacterium]|nr:outer membrane protein assembly factor BamA [Syntrophales bacterium]